MTYKDKGEITREYYRRQGEQRERERIIKLLEDYAFDNGFAGGILYAVELIKRNELVVK
jgi:hypothetical protein